MRKSILWDSLLNRTLAFAQSIPRWPESPSQELLRDSFLDSRIAVACDPCVLGSYGGRLMITSVVNLASRFCPKIDLLLPKASHNPMGVPRDRPEPPLALGELVRFVAAWADLQIVSNLVGQYDIVLAIGPVRDPRGPHAPAVFVNGDGWDAILRTEPTSDVDFIPEQMNPLGPILAANLAATEAMKAIIRKAAKKAAYELNEHLAWDIAPAQGITLSLLNYEGSTNPGAPDLPEQVDLGEITFIGAGAIVTCTLHALLSVPHLRGYFHLMDPKILDEPDLNRYLLCFMDHLAKPKVDILASLSRPGLTIDPHRISYEAFRNSVSLPLDVVVMGVDHIPSRWDVQRDHPRLLLNGATEGDRVRVSVHHAGVDAACVGCLNPDQGKLPNDLVAAVPFVSNFAGLVLAAELLKERLTMLADYRLKTCLDAGCLRLDSTYNTVISTPGRISSCPCCSTETSA